MRLDLAAQPPCSQKAKAQTLKTGTLDKKGQVLVAYSLFATSPQRSMFWRKKERLSGGSRELNHHYNTKQNKTF
jgi:hypothetical protein